MKNVRSRMNNYQTSDPQDDNQNGSGGHDSPQFEADDPNQVEILFDPNEALAGFGNPSRHQAVEQNYRSSAYANNDDDNYVGEKMGSGNSSGFFEHEDANEPQMAEPQYYTEKQAPDELEEIDMGFNIHNVHNIQNDNDFQMDNIPENVPTYKPAPEIPTSSFTNYQISAAARGGNKKKPPVRTREPARPNKPEILHMQNDDIGEVGEWVGKSANVHQKNEDSDDNDDDEQRNDDDDFEGVFDQTDAGAARNRDKPAATRNRNRGEDDDEEEERAERAQNTDFNANFAEQSSKAMQKAQESALRNARNRGIIGNTLKEKAKNMQAKAQDKVYGVNDGDIRLKGEAQKPNIVEEEEEGEEKRFEEEAQPQQKGHHQVQKEQRYAEEEEEEEGDLFANGDQKEFVVPPGMEEEMPEELEDIMDLNNALDKQSPLQKKKSATSPVTPIDEWESVSKMNKLNLAANNQVPVQKKEKPQEKPKEKPQKVTSPTSPDEWEMVSKATAQQVGKKGQKEDLSLVRFDQAWEVLRKLNLAEEKRKVQQDLEGSKGFLQKLFGSCSGGGLPAPLLDERDHVLALAKVPFSEEEPLHFNMLQTIYSKLTGKKEPVARCGSHWELIGFQGRDPATDLRGVGLLGLAQLLAFASENEKLFKTMFEYSIHDKYNFPLCICGLSVTQTIMEVVRAGKLNTNINRKKSVITAMNEAYFATFYTLYCIYRENSYTIQDYPKAKMAAFEMAKDSLRLNLAITEYDKGVALKIWA